MEQNIRQFNITGMSCAACSARVEKAVSALPGVSVCSVNLLTNSMQVSGSVSDRDIINAVTAAGYGAALKGEKSGDKAKSDDFTDTQTPVIKKRLIASLCFLLPLMYVSMGHNMLSLPLPKILSNPMAIALTQLIFTAIVMEINRTFFINGFKGVIHKAPNMDTLVSLGAGAAFIYSLCVMYIMTDTGDNHLAHDLYFESTAMILTLITVGKMLESGAKGKTTDALKSLMDLTPKTAIIMENGQEREIPSEDLFPGDIFLVYPGAYVPVDGVVIEGDGAVDESALTGESIPVDKVPGSRVSSATVNTNGFLKCRATAVGEDTALSQIIKTVSDAAGSKAPIAKLADNVSGVFVPVVISIAGVTLAVWLLLGKSFGFALARAISVLVISCPCALGLATPVAIMVGSGLGAKKGILFKTAAALEHTGRMNIVALDKTGTITSGTPEITDIIPAENVEAQKLILFSASLESKSEHPLSRAILRGTKNLDLLEVINFKALPGNGLMGRIEDKAVYGGNLEFVKKYADVPQRATDTADALSDEGKTPLFFALDNQYLGMIAVADSIKPDSRKAIEELKNLGLYVVMLTGDNGKTAAAIAKEAGCDGVYSSLSPSDKAEIIKHLSQDGKVLMVGDGINDAPALTVADIGMAIGAGTDIAMESANVVLTNSRLTDAAAAVRLGRQTLKIIKENLFWAFFYNAIGIPIAAGVLTKFGVTLNPMLGSAAMSLSSFCVVSNALRLNIFDPYNSSRDKGKKPEIQQVLYKKEKKTMTTTVKIEGMMCPHCEANVKKGLEALDGIISVTPSHEKNIAVIEGEFNEEAVKKVIEEKGYIYLGV